MALGCGDIRDLAKLLNISNPDNDQDSSSDDDEEANRKKQSLKLGKITIVPHFHIFDRYVKTTQVVDTHKFSIFPFLRE